MICGGQKAWLAAVQKRELCQSSRHLKTGEKGLDLEEPDPGEGDGGNDAGPRIHRRAGVGRRSVHDSGGGPRKQGRGCTDKKENQIFLIYHEIQSGAVAKSYMRKGFLIYGEMRKYFPIYEEAVGHI